MQARRFLLPRSAVPPRNKDELHQLHRKLVQRGKPGSTARVDRETRRQQHKNDAEQLRLKTHTPALLRVQHRRTRGTACNKQRREEPKGQYRTFNNKLLSIIALNDKNNTFFYV